MSATTSPASSTADPPIPKGRRRIWVWLKRGTLGLVAALAGLSLLGIIIQTIGSMRDARRFPTTGQMVDAGGYRLHMVIAGSSLPGPYVLVGHSAGGLNMLVFADSFPQETGGIVLVDSTHPDQFLRYPSEQAQGEKTMARMSIMFEWGARLGILRLMNGPRMLEAEELPADQKDALQAYFASPRFGSGIAAELSAFDDLSFPQVRAIQSLGAVPMIVLTAGQTAEQVPVQVVMHKEYASLSTNSLHRTITGASHGDLVINSKYLPEVTAAVRQVFEAARDGGSLQP
jgi:pimeloyl-ACP methyl ester carboxylesterase